MESDLREIRLHFLNKSFIFAFHPAENIAIGKISHTHGGTERGFADTASAISEVGLSILACQIIVGNRCARRGTKIADMIRIHDADRICGLCIIKVDHVHADRKSKRGIVRESTEGSFHGIESGLYIQACFEVASLVSARLHDIQDRGLNRLAKTDRSKALLHSLVDLIQVTKLINIIKT